MKNKILIASILIVTFLIKADIVKGYSNRYFDLTIPSGYELTTSTDGTYQWVNKTEGSNYVVSVKLKNVDKSILDFTTAEKQAFVTGIVNNLEAQYKETYGKEIPVEIITATDDKLSSYDAIFIKVKINDFLSTGYTLNQYIFVTESKNLLYSVVYSTSVNTYNDKDFKLVKDSFKINDDMPKSMLFETAKDIGIVIIIFTAGFLTKPIYKKIKKGYKNK